MRNSLVYLPVEELEKRCRFETLRRSGPGGQNRNKVETGVRFYLDELGLVGEATERRYQGENRKIALHRLRMELALTVREIPALGGDAPLSDFKWFDRLVGGKIRVSSESFDYPILVAEFFDVYSATGGRLSEAATLLNTTSSQIVRFLRQAPSALEALNAQRAREGLPRLKA